MKNGKKCWKMKSIAGIILTCIFLTACGEETKELMTGNDELKILEEVEKQKTEKQCTNWQVISQNLIFRRNTQAKLRSWASRDFPGWIRTARVTVRWK